MQGFSESAQGFAHSVQGLIHSTPARARLGLLTAAFAHENATRLRHCEHRRGWFVLNAGGWKRARRGAALAEVRRFIDSLDLGARYRSTRVARSVLRDAACHPHLVRCRDAGAAMRCDCLTG